MSESITVSELNQIIKSLVDTNLSLTEYVCAVNYLTTRYIRRDITISL